MPRWLPIRWDEGAKKPRLIIEVIVQRVSLVSVVGFQGSRGTHFGRLKETKREWSWVCFSNINDASRRRNDSPRGHFKGENERIIYWREPSSAINSRKMTQNKMCSALFLEPSFPYQITRCLPINFNNLTGYTIRKNVILHHIHVIFFLSWAIKRIK